MAESIERLLFPAGDDSREAKAPQVQAAPGDAPELSVGQDELLLTANRKLTLRCGKSSITLFPNGKIVLRGEYILSEAEGINRINGGRIELN